MRKRLGVFVWALLWVVGLSFLFQSEVGASGSPYFNFFAVLASNRSDGIKTYLGVYGIVDPEGSVPASIASMTVNGPNDFFYSFLPGDYSQPDNGYYHELPGLPADGKYALTVTSTSGKTRTSAYWLTVGETIPLPDPSTFQASGTDPLTPTFSWSAIPGYASGTLCYKIWISDMNGTSVWDSAPAFNTTSVTVPSGYLLAGKSYQWQVGAYDNTSTATSNKRSKSNPIPLVLDNGRPYFSNVSATKFHKPDGSFYTNIWARGGLPSGEPALLTVTGPNNGFVFTTTPSSSCFLSSNGCNYPVSVVPEDGLYAFEIQDADNNSAVSYFRLYSYDVPSVDSSTMRASGNALTPVLSWSAPVSIYKPIGYQVWIRDSQDQAVWNSGAGITNTSVGVPPGVLQSVVSYQWHVMAYDHPYLGSANRSNSSSIPLTAGNSTPYFTYVMIDDRNTHDGHFIGVNAQVTKPNGSVPASIASLTVTAPRGESYSFQPGDYTTSDNEYYHQFFGAPPEEGLYTFTVTDKGGNSTSTHLYYLKGGGTVPLLNEATFQVTGTPLAPTISWSAPSGYHYHPYYRVRVLDSSGKAVYTSPEPYSSYTSQTVPSGKLVSGKVYRYRIEAFDSPIWQTHRNRAVSNWLQPPAGGLVAKDPYFRNCSVLPNNTPSGIVTILDAIVTDPDGSAPDTVSTLTVSGPNDFTYAFTPADYHGSGEYWHDLPGLPDEGQYTFTVTDIDGHTATTFYYVTAGQTIPLPDHSTIVVSGTDPVTPILSWGAIPGYPGNLFYRARIFDLEGNTVWTSGIGFNNTSVTVPRGVLVSEVSYEVNVHAFDSFGYYSSSKRSSGLRVPLDFDNTRPYFATVAVFRLHNFNTYSTVLVADKGDPSDTAVSLEVTGPNEFQYTFDFEQECYPLPGTVLHRCSHNEPGSLQDGNYTFTFTNAYDLAVSHFRFTSYDVPIVDNATMQASGNTLTPTLSWGAPATVDRPLYYVVFVNNMSGTNAWNSGWTTQTSVAVPSGKLQAGVSYQWNVAANDSKYLYSSNRSLTPMIPLTVNPSPPRLASSFQDGLAANPPVPPYFSYADIYDRNTPEGHFTTFNVQIGDPDGSIPTTIASLTVTGPEGFNYSFQPTDYLPAFNEYYHQTPQTTLEGLYAFTVTDNTGRSAVTHTYHRHAGGPIPLFDQSSFQLSGHPLLPTLSWSAIAGYANQLYYRLRILNNAGTQVYSSSPSPSSYQSVPSGVLSSGTSYQYRVEAVDSPDVHCFNNRAVSDYLQMPTAVEVSSFRAKAFDYSVLLEWDTGAELNNAGFHIWRARSPAGKYTRITKAPIPAKGSPSMGSKYSFEDSTVVRGKSYSYKLEDIDMSGKSTFHGPVRAVVGGIALISPRNGQLAPGKAPPAFAWESKGFDRFRLQISDTSDFSGKVKTLSGLGGFRKAGWMKTLSYTPVLTEWNGIRHMLGKQDTFFWRVLGKDRFGTEGVSGVSTIRMRN